MSLSQHRSEGLKAPQIPHTNLVLSTAFPQHFARTKATDYDEVRTETAAPVDISTLPVWPQQRSWGYLFRQLTTPMLEADTGLAHLTTAEFLAVARATRAFAFATETALRAGWWTSLLQAELLGSAQGFPLRSFFKERLAGNAVVEVGPGEYLAANRRTLKKFGASSYTGIDLQSSALKQGGLQVDALQYFSEIPEASVGAILAFGVFNEPMSLQFPVQSPPFFLVPAKSPSLANRAHAEHEYVRRLTTEMHRALKPGGLFCGDGLHSRRVEFDVEYYLRKAGFTVDQPGFETLHEVDLKRFAIRDPFFFKKD